MSTLTIARMTFQEAHRRWILWAVILLGLAFLGLFAVGSWLVYREVGRESSWVGDLFEIADFFLLAGLYAVSFLVVMLGVLTSVDTIAGEISSGTIQTVVTRPVRRWQVVLGKWLGLATMLSAFAVTMSTAIILITWLICRYVPRNPVPGVALIVLEGLVMLSLTILGGTRLSTLGTGVVVFMVYGLAFIGGWIEQFGAFLQNQSAINVGIVTSLLMPAEAMWRRAAYLMEPPFLTQLGVNPFASSSPPSPAMVAYAALYVTVALVLAMVIFSHRDL